MLGVALGAKVQRNRSHKPYLQHLRVYGGQRSCLSLEANADMCGPCAERDLEALLGLSV
jgi:hypothetical protein